MIESTLPSSPIPDELVEREARLLIMHATIDEVERRMMDIGGPVRGDGEDFPELPVIHHFVPGMYCREIFMPKGSIVTSYVHRYEHPYVVSKGDCWVLNAQCVWDRVTAPHFGVTLAGTRRLLVMCEDTIWTTFHITSTTDVEKVEREIFIRPDNPFYPPENV